MPTKLLQEIEKYSVFRLMNGIRTPEESDSLEIILSQEAEVKKIREKGIPKNSSKYAIAIKKTTKGKKKNGENHTKTGYEDDSLIRRIVLSHDMNKAVIEAMQVFEKGGKDNVSFIPVDGASREFKEYCFGILNKRTELFFTSSLPEIYNLFGINTADYYHLSIRDMDIKSELTKEMVAYARFIDKNDKKYLLDLIEKETKYDIKGVNINFYNALDYKKMSKALPIYFGDKIKDRLRLSSKDREKFLDILDAYKSALKEAMRKKGKSASIDDIAMEMRISLKDFEITDYKGIEVVVPEGQEATYVQKLLQQPKDKKPRFIPLEIKTEKDLEGIEELKKKEEKGEKVTPLFPEKYNSRFRHYRIKVYDTETQGIIDIHISNLLSKIIKDYCPGLSHSQRSAGLESKLDKRHKDSPKLKKAIDSFFEPEFRLRGFEYELKFFNKAYEDRPIFLIHCLYNEFAKIFPTRKQHKTIREMSEHYAEQRKVKASDDKSIVNQLAASLASEGLTKKYLKSIGKESNLSVVLDLLYYQIADMISRSNDNTKDNATRFYTKNYEIKHSLTRLLRYAHYTTIVHDMVYEDTYENKQWRARKNILNELFNYFENVAANKETIAHMFKDASETKKISNKLQETSLNGYELFENVLKTKKTSDNPLIRIGNALDELVLANYSPQQNVLNEIHPRIKVDLMTEMLSAFDRLTTKLSSYSPDILKPYLNIYQETLSKYDTMFSNAYSKDPLINDGQWGEKIGKLLFQFFHTFGVNYDKLNTTTK